MGAGSSTVGGSKNPQNQLDAKSGSTHIGNANFFLL